MSASAQRALIDFSALRTVDAANSLPGDPLPGHPLYKGDPSLLDGEKTYLVSYDTAKEKRILELKLHTMLETTQDTLADIAKRGW